MPRRNDLKTIMVLGSGPIKIGQAAEFDFSGSQAVRATRGRLRGNTSQFQSCNHTK